MKYSVLILAATWHNHMPNKNFFLVTLQWIQGVSLTMNNMQLEVITYAMMHEKVHQYPEFTLRGLNNKEPYILK